MNAALKKYAVITLGSRLYALAYDAFFAAGQAAMAGVTGLGQILHHLFPVLPVGTVVILLNLPLFFAGWRLIGRELLLSSLYSMALSSLAIDTLSALADFPALEPLLSALCGGALMGLGLGLVFSQGATTGGTDIAARLLKLRLPWLPMGALTLVPDGLVLALAAVVLGRIEAVLCGAVALFVSSRTLDAVLYGLDTAKAAFIISDRWEELNQALLTRQGRGVTVLRGSGGYTAQEKHVLLVAFRQREIVDIRHIVRDLDPGAFMIVCSAWEVLGEGFGDVRKEAL